MIDAIVLAGGSAHDKGLIAASGQECKAMIEIAGHPVVWWVVEALKGCKQIGTVTVVSREACKACVPNADIFLEEAEDETANLVKALNQGAKTDRVFMVSGDTALLTSKALDDLFLNAPDGVDIVYPLVERNDIEREFPERKWIYFMTPEGHFTGSSCFLFQRQAVLDRVEWVRRVFDARRSVFQLARMWGLSFILKFAFHRLTLDDAAQTAGRVLGLSGKAYVSHYTELAIDLDHADDLPIMEKRLAEKTP